METKKCPRCGAEIPTEMHFCLHCMERTDGVLEIKKKTEPSRKFMITAIILSVLMTVVIILLVMLLSDKNNDGNITVSSVQSETMQITTETSADIVTNTTETTEKTEHTEIQKVTSVLTDAESEMTISTTENYNSDTVQKTDISVAENNDISEQSYIDVQNTEYNDYNEEQAETIEEQTETINVQPYESEAAESSEEPITDIPTTVSFEDAFTERLNEWAGSRILTDTLSFNENGCTFSSSVGVDKVNCTVTASSDMADFTLLIEPDASFMSYSTSVYIPAIINEITYFVLDYRMSNGIQTDISTMFENFEPEGDFTEDNLNCHIFTQEHNNGSYPITVNCSIS